ncbi:MAG: hypothetical protein LBC63_09180 [Holophagales bacterium]|jgi:hypothetical protein|nr:hypothetical protein [Holophagales bacterium]
MQDKNRLPDDFDGILELGREARESFVEYMAALAKRLAAKGIKYEFSQKGYTTWYTDGEGYGDWVTVYMLEEAAAKRSENWGQMPEQLHGHDSRFHSLADLIESQMDAIQLYPLRAKAEDALTDFMAAIGKWALDDGGFEYEEDSEDYRIIVAHDPEGSNATFAKGDVFHTSPWILPEMLERADPLRQTAETAIEENNGNRKHWELSS